MRKKKLGQYFTITNPFNNDLFKEWFGIAYDNIENKIVLEPFAGNKDIVCHIDELYHNKGLEWDCYDIEPKQDNVRYNDSIQLFPTGYDMVITNPPYLAKTSASRLKLPYPDTYYDDVYKLCVHLMLKNCKYIAAIIPESFITSDLFHDRLYGVISLNIKMFTDTECPVCLALFVPRKESDDFVFYVGNNKVGNYNELKKYNLSEFSKDNVNWKFNDPYGIIGVKCVDNQVSNDIYFHHGDKIKSEDIKVSSRAFTRISGLPDNIDLDDFIKKCNIILNEYRDKTHDIFLTSFKGLRKDGVYRRRIDFRTVKCIMNKAIKLY